MKSLNKWQNLFQSMIDQIESEIKLNMVILFGSQGREEATRYSDYDILLVGDFKGSFLERSDWVIKFAPLLSLDLFCYKTDEFEEMFESYALTAIDAIGEGVVLYGKTFYQKYRSRYDYFLSKGMRKSNCALIPPII